METNSNYKIKDVTVTTNGRNELYFHINWEGDRNLDYYELRIWESDQDNCLELCPYASHDQLITVKDFYFLKNWKSKEVNKETFYIELGIPDYSDDGKLLSWEVMASYEPIELNLYYEFHIFRKNVLEKR